MIRGVIGLFIFAVALCAYIVVAPNASPPAPALSGTMDVTRAQTETLLPSVPLPEVEAPQEEVVIAPTVPFDAPPEVARVETDNSTVFGTTSGVLAGLGLEVTNLAPTPEGEAMARQTDNVLASIGSVTGAPVRTTAPSADTALERLMVAALKEGRTDAEIDEMVNAAAIAGKLAVPEVLVTADGRIDTHVLLKSIVVQATIASGGAEPAVPDLPADEGVEVRYVRAATQSDSFNFYTVSPGDSLGAIAIKFYGNVDKYPLIFQANRDILPSPDDIQVGQRLSIPKLPEV